MSWIYIKKKLSTIVLLVTIIVLIVSTVVGKFYSQDYIGLVTSVFVLLCALCVFLLNTSINSLSILEKIDAEKFSSGAKALKSPLEIYKYVANVIDLENYNKNGRSILRHAILHASIGNKRLIKKKRNKIFARFDETITNCIMNSGIHGWEVRQAVLVTDLERFEFLLKKMESKQLLKGENYVVRVFLPPFSVPYVSPLIVGDENGFIAYDGQSEFRVKAGIHISGKENVEMLIEYFDSVWNAPGSFEIRSATHMNLEIIDKVKELIKM